MDRGIGDRRFPLSRAGEVGWGGFAPQPRVSDVKSYHVSILSHRCARRLQAAVRDSHTAMGFIVLFGSRYWGSPLPASARARSAHGSAGAPSQRDAYGSRCGELPREHLVAPLCPALARGCAERISEPWRQRRRACQWRWSLLHDAARQQSRPSRAVAVSRDGEIE